MQQPASRVDTLGRYRLRERLGQGGMATVYRAEDPKLGRDVAVKVMHPFVAERDEAARRFEREARAVAGLRHANVLQLHDYHAADGETPAYLVMELLTGPSLRAFLDKHGAPLAEVGAMIGLRVAQALAAAHAAGIVHRDIKPENVMFDRPAGAATVRVVLCDFGIARIAADAAASGMTATGAIIGSPAYMSPEQARGDSIDARSDVFSLGSLLYLLSTGAPPFTGPQPLTVMNRIAKGEHAPPSAKNPRVPRWLERAIERCLRLDPAQRFADALAVADALVEGLRGDGLADADAELTRYVDDPPAYNAGFGARIIGSALGEARRAATDGQSARALAAASRVLSWDPAQPEALSLIGHLNATPRRRAGMVVAAVLVAATAGALWVRARSHTVVAAPAPLVAVAAAPPIPVAAPPLSPVAAPPVSAAPPLSVAAARHKKTRIEPAPSEIAATAPAATPPQPIAPPVAAAPTSARLTVAIAPWCDLTVDGTARGRTPQTLTLPPGHHHVECANPSAPGVRLVRDVTLLAGGDESLREHLYAAARITPHFTHADAFALDDAPAAAGARTATPGRHRITLYAAGRELETRYLDIPPDGCRLLDTPAPACEKP